MLRTRFVLPVVLLLGMATIVAVVVLQHRADQSRSSQQTLGEVKLEVERLQTAPIKGFPGAGGSPEAARRQFQTSRRRIAAGLAKLDDGSAPPSLRKIAGPLRRNVAQLKAMTVASAPSAEGEAPSRVPDPPTASHAAIQRLLDAAGREYSDRAERSATQATIGSAVAIVLLLAAFAFFFLRSARLARENDRLLAASRHEALTDALTGLGNRRALLIELNRELSSVEAGRPLALGIYDLDGFKQYNDTFGHPAGDALLARLGERLQDTVDGTGAAYRMGGDEFCVLAPMQPGGGEPLLRRAVEALSEAGEGFMIGCSYGAAYIPAEASSGEDALRLADQRLYEEKASRSSASRQTTDALLTVLGERRPGLSPHLPAVVQLVELTAERLGLPDHEVKRARLATELHDIGKTGIPEEILNKPGKLDDHEWAFIRRHTLIGERIVRAAPSLAHTAQLVRSSHERFDGQGYPDGLSENEIPLGASIVAVSDAFEAMISERPYRPPMSIDDALAELRRGAGTQFHPDVVEAFCAAAQQAEIVASASG